MTGTTGGCPPVDVDEPTLPKGLLEQALSGPSDPRRNPALLELIQRVLPYAMTLIETALDDTKPRRTKAPTTSQMRELVYAQHIPQPDDNPREEDPEVRAEIARRTREAAQSATEAALRSAAASFHGHWIKEFADVRSRDDLALHLIRLAYNRYQKRRRQDARLGRQVASSGAAAHSQESFLESRPDESASPALDAEFHDFLEIQQRLTDGVLEGFSVRDRQIILLHEAAYEPEAIVELMNRLNKRRKPCTLNTVNHVIETFRAQLGRLGEPDDEDRLNEQENPDDDNSQPSRRRNGSSPRSPEEPPTR
jgi:hypothetical protein